MPLLTRDTKLCKTRPIPTDFYILPILQVNPYHWSFFSSYLMSLRCFATKCAMALFNLLKYIRAPYANELEIPGV